MRNSSRNIDKGAETRKLVIIGAEGTGKTSLINRFVKDEFLQTQQTIGAAHSIKEIEINGERVTLGIWDTAGQEKYRSLAPNYYRDAEAAIIVYDVTSKKHLKKLKVGLLN